MAEGKGKRVLVVDDEADVTELLGYHLKTKGYTVETLNDSTRSVGVARSFVPDLVVLDVMMPEVNGIQICRMLRADPKLKAVPIIFLTARAEENDRVLGLETGADDYLAKPFSIKELLLRINGLIRRSSGSIGGEVALVEVGRISLDPERHTVAVSGQTIELTATEFRLLKLLMERKGRVQTREHLLLNVWNYETEIETRTVDTHIRRLREKLGTEAELIETIRGVGYRMVDRKPDACPS
jgi:two-component system phosphate regulon response regulator PhoB